MPAIRKLLSLARIEIARAAAFLAAAMTAPAVPMAARPAPVRVGASMGALRLYSLPRGVRQR